MQLIRPTQQVKNGAVLLGALASGNVSNSSELLKVLILILAWVGLSGFIYIFNDLTDINLDKLHPEKSKRPIASGKINPVLARFVAIPTIILSILLFGFFGYKLFFIAISYLVINLSYSLYLKNIVVIELLLVSSGFVLRGLSGILVVNAIPSVWFVLLSLFGSLLLVAGKRSAQRIETKMISGSNRKVVNSYSETFLLQLQIICTTGLLISYVLMTQERAIDNDFQRIFLYASIIPFITTVLYINYFQDKEPESELTRLLLARKPLAISTIVWFITFSVSVVA